MEGSCWRLGGVSGTLSRLSHTPSLCSSPYLSPTSWGWSSKPSTTAASTPNCGDPRWGTQDCPMICLMQKCPLKTFPSRTAPCRPSLSTNGWPAMLVIFTQSKESLETLIAQIEQSRYILDVRLLLINVTFCGSDGTQQSLSYLCCNFTRCSVSFKPKYRLENSIWNQDYIHIVHILQYSKRLENQMDNG